ncbi:MAG: TetR/AcrR family transcriptional regulator [candidate division Zixibacteria bacterium]|nr:TetR/AcrR family transcriptional regulator [candidate division Zixibacteria bacterium]
MAKIKQSPKQPPEKRRHQLLTAARKLFIRKGYRGTTTEMIAREARLTKGAVYYHFKCKEDILYELMLDIGRCYETALAGLVERGDFTPTDILEALVASHKSDDLREFRNIVDLWVQALRIPRIGRYLADGNLQIRETLAKGMNPAYGRTLRERRTVTDFTMCYYDGLAARKSARADSIDLKVQIKMFDELVKSLHKDRREKAGVA